MAARFSRRICVGDRVPSLDCARADGSPTSLHAELGGEWALLVPPSGDAGGPAAGPGTAPGVEPNGAAGPGTAPGAVEPTRLTRTDGVPEAWLVRPDGHLAWRGTDPAAAAPWLAEVLQSGRAR
ncbi:aromatic-ring hydroxylase C-terminal domain-containing protein [Promicromonospora soli]